MDYFLTVINEIYKILFLVIPILVSVAMIVWFDRRVWGLVQKRRGPNVVGAFGLLQSFADLLKSNSSFLSGDVLELASNLNSRFGLPTTAAKTSGVLVANAAS